MILHHIEFATIQCKEIVVVATTDKHCFISMMGNQYRCMIIPPNLLLLQSLAQQSVYEHISRLY